MNSSTLKFNPTVAVSLAGQVSAVNDITVSGRSTTNGTAYSTNASGGFIAVGLPLSTSDQTVSNTISVGGHISAGRDLTIETYTDNTANAASTAATGGVAGIAPAESDLTIGYTTKATIEAAADLFAAGAVRITGDTKTSQTAKAIANGIGLGGDANALSTANASGTTEVDIGNAASVIGNTVLIAATVSIYTVDATADGRGAGFVAVGTADADITDNLTNKVDLAANAAVTGYEGVDFRTRFDAVHVVSHTFSRATGLFGVVHSESTNSSTLTSEFDGAGAALVTAGPRDTAIAGDWDPIARKLMNLGSLNHLALFADTSNGPSITLRREADSSKRSLATGGDNGNADVGTRNNTIDFNSDVLILSGRSPELTVESDNTISRMVNLSASISGGVIHVDNITNDDPGQVFFGTGGSTTGSIAHTKALGTWEFRDTFDHVRIINKSKNNLEIKSIHVVNTTVNPTVDLSQTKTLGLEFKIKRTVAPTVVDIESTNIDPPDVTLSGIIENPIGTTRVVNVHGNILSNASRGDGGVDASSFDPSSLIRTNILDLEAKNGSIGQNPGDAFGQMRPACTALTSTSSTAPMFRLRRASSAPGSTRLTTRSCSA